MILSPDSPDLCRELVQGAPDAILFSDRDGIIRLWNGGAATLFGWSADAAVGESLDLIIPETLRRRHWEGYRRVIETGESRYGSRLLAVPALRLTGSPFSSEFSIVMVRGTDGQVAGIGAILRDVTERWQREKALKEHVRQLEERCGGTG